MSQMVNTLGGIAVECGGTVLAHAAGYSVKSSRAVVAVRHSLRYCFIPHAMLLYRSLRIP